MLKRGWTCVSRCRADELYSPPGWRLHRIDAGIISHIAFKQDEKKFVAFYRGSPEESLFDHCLNEQVIPRLLSLSHPLILHAGALAWEARSMAFLGQSGQGKSTLTGSLNRLGMPIISDDSLILRRESSQWCVEQVSPLLRLLPDSIEHLFPAAPLGAHFPGYSSKRQVSFTGRCRKAPLAALFVIDKPTEKVEVHRLTAGEGCMAIVANTFALDPNDRQKAAMRLVAAAEVARHIPVFSLHYPRNYSLLPSVHVAIFQALERFSEKEHVTWA